jgi:hypothetical protein
MEMLLMMMEIDVLPFKILVPSSSYVLVEMVMEVVAVEMAETAERQGSATKGVCGCVLLLYSSPPYIGTL